MRTEVLQTPAAQFFCATSVDVLPFRPLRQVCDGSRYYFFHTEHY